MRTLLMACLWGAWFCKDGCVGGYHDFQRVVYLRHASSTQAYTLQNAQQIDRQAERRGRHQPPSLLI